MRKQLIAGAALALTLGSAAAAADDQARLSVTIYNGDLALVQDQRSIDMPAGRTRLEFKDVSPAIRPETVTLSAPGVGIVEQNFDFDLLSPGKMMEKAIGQQVRIVRINPGTGQQITETATVLAVNEGVVLRIGDHIEVLRDDGVPTRVIFDKVPENLRARPTLSVTVDSERAGPRQATLSYLTRGLTWKADYVALFDEKTGKLDLQGWITLTNTSGGTYANARTQLVAGTIKGASEGGDSSAGMVRGGAGVQSGGQKQVADYYLYDLPQPTTIAENQTKQVSFLDARGVTAGRVYRYSGGFGTSETPTHAAVMLAFSNSSGGGLGSQMPAGVVRVYMRDPSGEPKFVGENRIGHTPQGSRLEIRTGEAFDVTVQPTLVNSEKLGERRVRYEMSYLVRNAKDEPVTVEIEQEGPGSKGALRKESLKSTRVDASTLAWSVPVPARGETTLTFTVEREW